MFTSTKKPQYDPTTGEQIGTAPVIIPGKPRPPVLANARRVQDVAGKQAEWVNLRDHPELNGKEIAIVGVFPVTGDMGEYIRIACYVLDSEGQPGEPVVIATGSQNVMERALAIAPECSIESPIIGKLEKVGEMAWLLD